MGIKAVIITMDTSSPKEMSKNLNLCFNKDDFMNTNFSVDKFVSEHRQHISLEKLRDDLSLYLKVLKSSMVELINQDYADFVNLSTNLAGLDKSIGNLCIPLGQLREEVLVVKWALDEALTTALNQLSKQRELRDKKLVLQRVSTVLSGVEKLERLSENAPFLTGNNQKTKDPVDGLIERIANELIHVHFHLNEIPNLPLIQDLKPKVEQITSTLHSYLDNSFLQSLHSNDRTKLQFILRINSTLGRTKDVEKLFLAKVAQPYMSNIISEQNLKMGIDKMYKDVLDFIPLKCKHFLELTINQTGMPEAITGYNILVNVIFPEIIKCLESRVPSIFSPGNPEEFHKNYLASEDFLYKFENLCLNDEIRQKMKSSEFFSRFTSKWNLPVYFQIQFPKIAGTLEIALSKDFSLTNGACDYHLEVSRILFNSVEKCWTPDIFLPKLSHRFWKLTLQLLTRFCIWAEQISNKEMTSGASGQTFEGNISNGPNNTVSDNRSSVANLVMLVKDIETLQLKVPLYFNEVICPILKAQEFSNTEILKEGLDNLVEKLSKLPSVLESLITKQLSSFCGLNLKQVPDIPRLYRKTNKEVPSKPSKYVNILLNPLETFLSTHEKSLSLEMYQRWSYEVIERLTEQYLTVTRDVLHSVKRVEDSMKILRKAREKTPTLGNNQTNLIMSDDDKIRLQLLIDIEAYGQKIESLNLKCDLISSYGQLKELAESTRNSLSSNS